MAEQEMQQAKVKGIAIAIISGRCLTPVEMIPNMMMQSFPTNTNFQIFTIYGKETDEGRVKAVQHARQLKMKYLQFIDDDTVPPPDTVRNLAYLLDQHGPPRGKVMVAAAVYCCRSSPPEPLVFREQGAGPDWDWKVGEVLKRWGAGTGCMLVNLEIFDHIPEPWFKTVSAGAEDRWSDDLYFCDLVHQAGFELMVHGGILCHHYDYERGIIYQLPRNSYPYQNRISDPREPSLQPVPAPPPALGTQIDLLHNVWMSAEETLWLIDRAVRSQMFAEVGCWKGVTTRNIAKHVPTCKVFAIDHFNGSEEMLVPGAPGYEPRLRQPGWLLAEFNRAIRGLDNVTVIPFPSLAAARMAAEQGQQFDTIFIDGSHEYADVKEDIVAWFPLVKMGGILCGHDYERPDVRQAVEELLLPRVVKVPGTRIWMFQKVSETLEAIEVERGKHGEVDAGSPARDGTPGN